VESKWFGLFASIKAETSLLPGVLIKDADTTISIKEVDQTIKTDLLKAQESYNLTAGFAPFLLP